MNTICSACFPFKNPPRSWKKTLPSIPATLFLRLVVHALFWRLHLPMLLPLCFFTSTLFNGFQSSKTSSSVCAPSFQGLRLVLLCNKPAPSSSLSKSFSTVPTFLPSLSLFLSLFFLFASTKRPFRPTKVETYHSSNLSTSCTQTCPPLSEDLSCLFLFIRSSFLYISVILFLDNPPRLFTSAFVPSFFAFFYLHNLPNTFLPFLHTAS